MTIEEMKKYVGCYVSFDYALSFPKKSGTDQSMHIEGTLDYCGGTLATFGIEEFGGIALRDDFMPYIINFKVIRNNAKA